MIFEDKEMYDAEAIDVKYAKIVSKLHTVKMVEDAPR